MVLKDKKNYILLLLAKFSSEHFDKYKQTMFKVIKNVAILHIRRMPKTNPYLIAMKSDSRLLRINTTLWNSIFDLALNKFEED